MGEFLAVRTRSCGSVSGIGLGWKIRIAAILGAVFNRENLKAFRSNGLCKKRSEFGYSLRIFSIIDGPVSSNLLAPPTKQTAILDPFNSSFFARSLAGTLAGGEGEFRRTSDRCGVRLEKKDLRGAKEEMVLRVAAVAAEEMEKKMRREKQGTMRRRMRQSRSETNLMVMSLLGLFTIFHFLPLISHFPSSIRSEKEKRMMVSPISFFGPWFCRG